ncbi:hypothetical protein DL771_008582 [Monosporascus sp. 5C6A]|nr:hypothetical protein DL771_008582 [Monosporascus sp. 5C6A]
MSSDNIPDRGPAVFAVTTGTIVLASVFVGARIVSRVGIVRRWSWDDYFIVLAWILAFGLSFSVQLGSRNGLGRHDVDIPAEYWGTLRRCEYTFSILYNPALMATKTSVLVFYLRLSKNTERVLRLASWVVLGIVNVAGIVLTVMNIFQCRPVHAAFETYVDKPQCIPLLTEFICSAPVNIVTDLAILALPLPVLTGMRLPRRQKIILVLTFTLGVFITVVDVVRIYYLQQAVTEVSPTASINPAATFGDQPDFAWNASLSLMWSAVEVNIGVACACVPTLKPLIIRILPAMLLDRYGTRGGSDMADTKTRSKTSDNQQGDEGAGRASLPAASPEAGSLAPTVAPNGDDPGPSYPAMDFLTTPDMTTLPASSVVGRTRIAMTADAPNATGTAVYFGFVNMRPPKSMIRTSVADSFKYCTIVTTLFFIWGFSYGLLNTLNNAIATIGDMTTAQTLGLTSIYFGAGYFFGPLLVGEWVLRHDEHRRSKRNSNGHLPVGGFKATFMVGLCIYGVGTIMFWPSAVLTSFAGFMVCNFVVGFGLAVLETAANPFVALCGPIDYAEMRLLFSQAVQAVASVLSQLLAQRAFFKSIDRRGNAGDSTTLLDVQWTYLSITMFCAALALFLYYMPLPEVTDAEMENSTQYLPVDPKKRSLGGLQLRTWTLALAVLAQWTYVGAQESMSTAFEKILTPMITQQLDLYSTGSVGSTTGASAEQSLGLVLPIPDFLLIAHGAFALSRFIASYLAYLSPTHPRVPQPRTVLTVSTALGIICAILVTTLRPANPNMLAIPTVLFFFFEGPVWPLIFALGLRGQGKRMKRAAAWITMGASGPAFWPFVMYAVNVRGGGYQTSFAVVPALLIVTLVFSLFLDMKRDAQALVDARIGAEEQSRIQDGANRDMDLHDIITTRRDSNAAVEPARERKPSLVKRLSSAIAKGSIALRRTSEQATTDHREHMNEPG